MLKSRETLMRTSWTWGRLYFVVHQLAHHLPVGSGFTHGAQHLCREIESLEQDPVEFEPNEAAALFAALIKNEMLALQMRLELLDNRHISYAYLRGIYDCYHLIYPAVGFAIITTPAQVRERVEYLSKGHGTSFMRMVYTRIHGDISAHRYKSLDHLRRDLLVYIDTMRRSSLALDRRTQAIQACCYVLSLYH